MKLFQLVVCFLLVTGCSSKPKMLSVAEFVAPYQPIRAEHRKHYAALRNLLTRTKSVMREFSKSGADMEAAPYTELTANFESLNKLWQDFSGHHEKLEEIYSLTKEDVEYQIEEEGKISNQSPLAKTRDSRLKAASQSIREMKKIRDNFVEVEAQFRYVMNRDAMGEVNFASIKTKLVMIQKSFEIKVGRSSNRLKKHDTKKRELASDTVANVHMDEAKRIRAEISVLEDEVKSEIEEFNLEIGAQRKGMVGPGLRAHTIIQKLREKEKKAADLYRRFNSEMDKIDPRY